MSKCPKKSYLKSKKPLDVLQIFFSEYFAIKSLKNEFETHLSLEVMDSL